MRGADGTMPEHCGDGSDYLLLHEHGVPRLTIVVRTPLRPTVIQHRLVSVTPGAAGTD